MRCEAAVWVSLCLAGCAPAASASGANGANGAAVGPSAAAGGSPILLYGPGLDGTTDGAFCPEIAVDGAGTTFATGALRRPERIGGALVGGEGQADRRLAALRPDGSLAWSRALPGVDSAVVAADRRGRGVVLAGRLTRALDLGEGSLGDDDIGGLFVARFDEAGQVEWNRTVTSVPLTPTLLERDVAAVFVEDDGAVWLRATRDDRASGTSEVYVERFDAAGASLWSQRFAPPTERYAGRPGRPRNGAVGGGVLVFVVEREPSMALVALDALGLEAWSQPWPAAIGLPALAVAADGSVYAAGALFRAVDLGGGVLPGPSFSTEEDVYVVKYDPYGNHVWSRRFGESADAEIGGAVVDERGRLWIHGTARGGLVFAPGVAVPASPPAPEREARDRVPFVAVIDAEGAPLRALRVAGRGALGGSIAPGPGGVTLVARYLGELALDGLAGPAYAQADHLGCALVRIPLALGR